MELRVARAKAQEREQKRKALFLSNARFTQTQLQVFQAERESDRWTAPAVAQCRLAALQAPSMMSDSLLQGLAEHAEELPKSPAPLWQQDVVETRSSFETTVFAATVGGVERYYLFCLACSRLRL